VSTTDTDPAFVSPPVTPTVTRAFFASNGGTGAQSNGNTATDYFFTSEGTVETINGGTGNDFYNFQTDGGGGEPNKDIVTDAGGINGASGYQANFTMPAGIQNWHWPDTPYNQRVVGHSGNQVFEGSGGNGTRVVEPKGGHNLINIRTSGAFTIRLQKGDGFVNQVTGFRPAQDKIDLVGFTELASFADIQAKLVDHAGYVRLSLGGGEVLRLANVTKSSLIQTNFLLNGTTPAGAPLPAPTPPPGPTPPGPTPPTPSPSSLVPTPVVLQSAGYGLVRDYDFGSNIQNYTQLREHFQTRYPYANWTVDTLNDEWERYRDNDNHRFVTAPTDGGPTRLQLVAHVRSGLVRFGIESGMIACLHQQRGGVWEMRARVPRKLGAWPAFWMVPGMPDNGRMCWPPEVDMLEWPMNSVALGVPDGPSNFFSGAIMGNGRNASWLTTHFSLLDQFGSYHLPGSPDGSAGFHTWTVEWDASTDRFKTFFDGTLIVDRTYPWRCNDGGNANDAIILINLAVGGQWAGRNGVGPTTADFPFIFEVDYLRCWAKGAVTPPPAPPVTPPAPTPAGGGSTTLTPTRSGWTLIENYEFGTEGNIKNKTDLGSKFKFRYVYSGENLDTLSGNREMEVYRDYPEGDAKSNHVFTSNTLRLIARLTRTGLIAGSFRQTPGASVAMAAAGGTMAFTLAAGLGWLPNDKISIGRNDGFSTYAYGDARVTSYNNSTGATVLTVFQNWSDTAAHSDYELWNHNLIESGMLRSRTLFNRPTTGHAHYFESRIRVPGARGMFPAFWFNPELAQAEARGTAAWPPEVDIMEVVYNAASGRDDPTKSFHGVITGGLACRGTGAATETAPGWDQWANRWVPGWDYSAGFHTFAAEWEPDSVTFFVDGQKVVKRDYKWVHNDCLTAGPAHLLVNLAVGGVWTGAPTNPADFPMTLEVDFMRAWSR
jgi:beta-glucanase (GH16 family)